MKRQYVPADSIPKYIFTLLQAYEEIKYYDKEQQQMEKKQKQAGNTMEKYEDNVTEDSVIYGTDRSIAFQYEMSCFDERLTDSEINKILEELEEEHHKWELLSLYWQSYRNERSKYLALKKSLQEKFLELQKKQTIATLEIYNKKWNKCEQIVSNNLTEQNEHVNSVFRTMLAKEKLSKHEFEKILYDFRQSWKEVTTNTADECIALMEEPIYLEVIYVQNDPRKIGMRIPGFKVPVAPYQPRGNFDSKVGADTLLWSSHNATQVENTKKKLKGTAVNRTWSGAKSVKSDSKVGSGGSLPPSLQNKAQSEKNQKDPKGNAMKSGTNKQTPEQNKAPATPSGGSLKEPAPGTDSGKSKPKDGSNGLQVASQNGAQIKQTNKVWIPATLIVLGFYIAALCFNPTNNAGEMILPSVLGVTGSIGLMLVIMLIRFYLRKGRSHLPKKALKDTISAKEDQKPDVSKKPEAPEKQEASGKLDAPNKPEVSGKMEEHKKPEVPKKPEAPRKLKLPWSQKLPKKP
ncbi:hypothetical protein AK88_01370 [Plasmodium fragile]|uniref:Plasmodium RESA N-terminal domain-containing protein n=1 Tax=Plasmodium fragile TaxID=5857 RepID=A0A0D9QT99_PLAFR|nr:uncharacterized protein AK88_01370 [Plasmodium fragile]KJP88876.1 hypothetical protein AK88_01370 [Plasmodium fragile]